MITRTSLPRLLVGAGLLVVTLYVGCSDTHGCTTYSYGWSEVGFDINVLLPDRCPVQIDWLGQTKTFSANLLDPNGNNGIGAPIHLLIFNSTPNSAPLFEQWTYWIRDPYGRWGARVGGSYPVATGSGADEADIYSGIYNGSTVAAAVILNWSPPPALTATFSGPAYVFVASSGTYNATASNQQPPYSYQWLRNGANIAGATGSSWTYSPTHPELTWQLSVRVASQNGQVYTTPSQSVYGRYDVGTYGPEIVTSLDPPPQWGVIVNGGAGPYHYQWYFGDPLQPVGTDSPTWTFDITTNDGRYPVTVDVTDAWGNFAEGVVWVTFDSHLVCNPMCQSPTPHP